MSIQLVFNHGVDGMDIIMYMNIRTSANALHTLINFTGVDLPIWEKFILRRREYRYEDDLVSDVIQKYGCFPSNYEEWVFTYSDWQINTSKINQCMQRVCGCPNIIYIIIFHSINSMIKHQLY